MFEEFVPGIWTIARPQRFLGIETGTRTTIVRLADGGLFVHCPVALDDATRRAVDALGPVRAIVAASLFHHLYVGEWMRAYPDALSCACPGLERKRDDLPWQHVLDDRPQDIWAGELDQVFFSARFEKEVVFFHRASGTLITADSLIHLSTHPSRLTRVVAFLMGNNAPGKGYLERIAVRDRRVARAQVDRMLCWDIEGIILAHGALVHSNGRETLRAAYAWL